MRLERGDVRYRFGSALLVKAKGCLVFVTSPVRSIPIKYAVLITAFAWTLSAFSQNQSTGHIYVFAVGAGGYGTPATSLLHGSYNGNTVQYDADGNGYVNTDAIGNFSISGLYADRCASAPTPVVYLEDVITPPCSFTKTLQISSAGNIYTGTITLIGTVDPYISTAYDITSATGVINGLPVTLGALPSVPNSLFPVLDNSSYFDINNVYYPQDTPPAGLTLDWDGILFTDGTTLYNLYADGDQTVILPATTATGYGSEVIVDLSDGPAPAPNAASSSVLMSLMPVSCSQMPTLAYITLSEATTVAAAYALAPFANVSQSTFSTAPGNIGGARNAAGLANELVSGLTGAIGNSAPNGGIIPTAKIASLSDMVAGCSHPPNSAGCANLFSAATPVGGVTPTTTLQAILDIANNPSQNVGALYNHTPASSLYQPVLAAVPGDWALPITFSPSLATVTVTSASPTNSVAGATVNIQVLVTDSDGIIPSRNVSCLANGIALGLDAALDAHGFANVISTSLPVGSDNIGCTFGGSAALNLSASTAAPVTVVVNSPSTGMTLACSPTTILAGRTTGCTATLPAGVTGTVSFTVDGDLWQNVTPATNGIAIATDGLGLAVAASQPHVVTASYSGDSTHPATAQQASVTVLPDTGAGSGPVAVYSYSITQADGVTTGYAPNGNILAYIDSVNGIWGLGYDSLNRLTSSVQTLVGVPAQHGCWSYDSFGNMHQQYTSNMAFTSASGAACQDASGAVTAKTDMNYADSSNRVTSGGWRDSTGNFNSGAPIYDGVGNMTNDLQNSYLYDPDGHVCAMQSPYGGITGYLYDANGSRVAKGTLTNLSCDPDTNGFHATSMYIIGPDGQEMTEVDGAGNWVHTNVSAGGQMIATYQNDGKGVHFELTDWLGSRRVQTTYAGEPEDVCQSQPFGDGQVCSHPELEATDHHFTGKERDTESGLDYFGARYYASSMGRMMSPDWSSIPAAIPFADPADPQSFNLYSYVKNNPLNRVDPNGHNWFDVNGKWSWHEGDTWKNGDNTYTSKYTGLLVASATGTDKKTGATTYSLTLYDQNKAVATGNGFSGGNGNAPIRDGNYMIRLDIRDANGPNSINPNSALRNPPAFFGIQKMHDITEGNATWGVVSAYGNIRARLNPTGGAKDEGDYFHGQSPTAPGAGGTHGCLCYGTDNRFANYMWNNMPAGPLPVSVDTPVQKP